MPIGAKCGAFFVSRALAVGIGQAGPNFHNNIDVERAPVRVGCRPIVSGCGGLLRPWERYDEVHFHGRIGGFVSVRHRGDGRARQQQPGSP